MKLQKNKNRHMIAAFLVLTFAVTIIALPTANGHTPPWKIPTWMYVSVSPNPIGINQNTLVVWWNDKLMPTANGEFGDRWQGVTVEITKPDGTKETMGPYTSDPVGGNWFTYKPSQLGTYYFQAFFPEQTLKGAHPIPGGNQYSASEYINDTYLASSSEKASLTVQQEAIKPFTSTPLPTDYWTRPIYATNRDWYSIAGNWLSDGKDNPYTTAPETAHIVWTKPIDFGGITGGAFGDISYYTGSAYESKWGPPVIMQGRLYYNTPQSDVPFTGGLMCVDLRTGEEIWYRNRTRIGQGVIYDYESPNQHGTIGYLTYTSGGRMQFYDPSTGEWLFTITSVPSGTSAVGSTGEPLVYQWDMTRGWLALWNASAIPDLLLGETSGTNLWQWRPVGKTVNGSRGYQWNATIPKDLPRLSRDAAVVVYNNNVPEMIVGTSGCIDRYYTLDPFTVYALSLKPGQEGQLLWRKSYSPMVKNATVDPTFGMVVDPKNRVICLSIKETCQWWGFSLDSGAQLWGPTAPQAAFDMYRMEPLTTAVDGTLYAGSYSGILYAYDTKNGNLLWKSSLGSGGLEGPYEFWPMGSGSAKTLADGKIYTSTNEHSNTMPLLRGWSIYCINAQTGAYIWNITGLMTKIAIAEGYAVSIDGMDNQIYCFGKGQTAATVLASPKVSVQGNSVLIEGTVTDQSPGAKDTPAIADDSMTPWMEYLYHQQPKPTQAKGVKVHITAIDPNGNFQDIGNVTSDSDGMFGIVWTPPVPGVYKVTATFDGSKSYFRSQASTMFAVSTASSAVVTPTPVVTPPPTQTTAPTSTPIQPVSPSPTQAVNPPTRPQSQRQLISQ